MALSPLVDSTARNSPSLDFGPTVICTNPLLLIYSCSSSLAIARTTSLQDMDRGMRVPDMSNLQQPQPQKGINIKSFANAILPQSRFRNPQPVRKGKYLSVNIDDSLHQQGVRKLEKSLIGCMMLKQGVKPMPTETLKKSLDQTWEIMGDWKLITLGKGYFNLQFSIDSERDCIFSKRSWQSEFGNMRIQRCTPEFNPYKVESPLVNVWG